MTKKRIPEMTDELRALMPIVRDEWIAHGLSCEPIDRQSTLAGITAAYAAAKLPPPFVIGLPSPLGGAVTRHILQNLPAGVWDGVWDGVRDASKTPIDPWNNVTYGQHDAGWLSFYDTFRRAGLADLTAPLDGLTLIAKSAGWLWLHRNIVIVSDRPATLTTEPTPGVTHGRRLHNTQGPAITYRDGWALWAWHGQNVPQWAIESPTIDLIRTEKNTEIRRCAIESYGWDRYLCDLNVAPVSSEPDPGNPGQTLTLYELPADAQVYPERVRLLVMHNGSIDRGGHRRSYGETVPAACQTAIAAAAWQFDCDPTIYRQLQRAT